MNGTDQKLRVAVIGTGHIGRHHARNYAALADSHGLELVAVVDANREAAQRVAEACGTKALYDPADLLGQVDAVSVCVPTVAHYAVAHPFLETGVATLIEKPLAFDPQEAGALLRVAKQKGAILQVGHSERFNPAWSAVTESGIRPRFVQAERVSPYPFRSLDVSVVFDVMIHDLDLVLAAVGPSLPDVEVTGQCLLSPSCDMVDARLAFASGAVAFVSASRVHPHPVRRLRMWDDQQVLDVDLMTRTSCVQRRAAMLKAGEIETSFGWTNDEKNAARQRVLPVDRTEHDRQAEPLRGELAEFVDCVRYRREPTVSGDAGYAAVVLAHRIEQELATHRGSKAA